jgi:hypothetical protein
MLHLAGITTEPGEHDSGLAAARRVFLVAAPLFRSVKKADSPSDHLELFSPLWQADGRPPEETDTRPGEGDDPEDGAGQSGRLLEEVDQLTATARNSELPLLIGLLSVLRGQAALKRLPPSLTRLALPLALHRAGLTPKPAPGLIGGRLALGATRAASDREPITPWLKRGLEALAGEALGAAGRLAELTGQHRLWHDHLTKAGFRRDARIGLALDLLTTTPVLSAPLLARHIGCTPQGAGAMLRRLAELGIVSDMARRSRWKIYLAGDLASRTGTLRPEERPLTFSDPPPLIDAEMIESTLNGLVNDLDRLNRRAKARLAEAARD